MSSGRARRLGVSCLAATSLALISSCGPAESTANPGQPTSGHFFRGELVWGTPPATDFTLTDQHRRPLRLSDQRGRVVLIFFGFVQCPDVCPATLSTWAKVGRRLGADRDLVRFLHVTVDPERDTPESLGRHLAIFAPDFIGLTGTREELDAVYRAYEVRQKKLRLFEGEKGYVIEHTSHTFLVDPDGVLRLKYSYDTRSDDLYTDVRWLLDHRDDAAGERASTSIRVDDVWSRPTAAGDGATGEPPPETPGVMYLTITNDGARDDRLVEVRTEISEVAEIHETTHAGGRSRMAPVHGGVPIPAGETVAFAPGGLHVMLIDLRRDLLAGGRFPAQLVFDSGEKVAIVSEVRLP